MWTTNHKIGNGCDTMTQRLLHIWIIIGGWCFTIYHRPVGRWFLAGDWCVFIGTEVIQVYLMYGCYHGLDRIVHKQINGIILL